MVLSIRKMAFVSKLALSIFHRFLATVAGQMNATPPPTGFFAGYAVGASGK
jgi:hypothetical protein